MKKRILENISINLFVRVLSYLAAFVTVLYVTRVLQPVAFGKVAFTNTTAGYFVMFSALGMPIYAARTCAEKREDRRALSRSVNELWSINALLMVVSAAVFLLLILLVPRLRENRALLLIFGSAMVFQTMGCEWLFRGLEKFRFLAVATLCSQAAALVGIFLLVRSEENVLAYAALSVLAAYGSSIFCFFMLPRVVDFSFRMVVSSIFPDSSKSEALQAAAGFLYDVLRGVGLQQSGSGDAGLHEA